MWIKAIEFTQKKVQYLKFIHAIDTLWTLLNMEWEMFFFVSMNATWKLSFFSSFNQSHSGTLNSQKIEQLVRKHLNLLSLISFISIVKQLTYNMETKLGRMLITMKLIIISFFTQLFTQNLSMLMSFFCSYFSFWTKLRLIELFLINKEIWLNFYFGWTLVRVLSSSFEQKTIKQNL